MTHHPASTPVLVLLLVASSQCLHSHGLSTRGSQAKLPPGGNNMIDASAPAQTHPRCHHPLQTQTLDPTVTPTWRLASARGSLAARSTTSVQRRPGVTQWLQHLYYSCNDGVLPKGHKYATHVPRLCVCVWHFRDCQEYAPNPCLYIHLRT